jgi:nitrate/nitrite-specific signal transduction histidine kinase
LAPDREPEPWEIRLLETVARHIGTAINLSHCATRDRRLALLEERATIARELHDSLAQSLSYLKIQVSRLDAALRRPNGAAVARPIIEGLREGLSGAYRQLREILTTFRLTAREREILRLLGKGLSNKRIAQALGICRKHGQGPRQASSQETEFALAGGSGTAGNPKGPTWPS